MHQIRGYGWLILGGALAAIAVATPSLDWLLTANAAPALPAGGRVLVATLLFGTFSALHFRAHWVATLGEISSRNQRLSEAHARLRLALEDASRSIFVVADNLRELDPGALSATRRLYLEGAIEHARKLPPVLERAASAGREMVGPPPDPASP